jgi:GR25 family glycosyltransferase involved in LPS biosynthesis
MSHPQTFEDLLSSPCLVINLDAEQERLRTSVERLTKAGFRHIIRLPAVNARGDPESIPAEWEKYGSPPFAATDPLFIDVKGCPGKQGCFLSHVKAWRFIIDNDLPWAVIVEDDIAIHKDWATLAPTFFDAMPKDYGMCYLGFYCQPYIAAPGPVVAPVFCNHATLVTNAGARKLYESVIEAPEGVYTLDCLLNNRMVRYLQGDHDAMCKWYMWNAHMYPDPSVIKHPTLGMNDIGLMFQEFKPA